ncbi:MAG: hypothetical protein ABIL22_06630, partial [candidate division WOR-3 bacterium]
NGEFGSIIRMPIASICVHLRPTRETDMRIVLDAMGSDGRPVPDVAGGVMAAREWGDEIIFLRKLNPGPSDQSYGIQVARLAGLPKSVIERAKEVLTKFEEGEVFSIRKLKKTKLSQPDLFVDKK